MPTPEEYSKLHAALDSAMMAFAYATGTDVGAIDAMTLAQWLSMKAGRRDDWPVGKRCAYCGRGRQLKGGC